MRKAVASVPMPDTLLCIPAVSPEVLHSSVQHQVIGLKQDLAAMNYSCTHETTILVM